MLLLLGYPLSRKQLSDVATRNGIEHKPEDAVLAASAAVRRAGVGRLRVCIDSGDFEGWYFLIVESRPLPDIIPADSRPSAGETERCRAVKERLGITSDFVCYLGAGCSDERLPEQTPVMAMREGTDV
jgi:hypothetical protein